ncbi:MAG: M14-type cytosolic carboxypeptidase [Pseudomonadota bacterium]
MGMINPDSLIKNKEIQRIIIFCLGWIIFYATGPGIVLSFADQPPPGIEVSGGFEGSNIADIVQVSDTTFECKLKSPNRIGFAELMYSNGSHYHNWFMLRIKNGADQLVTITITNADWGSKEFWGDAKHPVYNESINPNTIVSEKKWRPIKNHHYSKPNYTFKVKPETDSAWVALSYPALPSHTESWINTYKNRPDLEIETVYNTSKGYPVYVLIATSKDTSGKAKKNILVYGQEHNNEQTGGWACQGLVEFLMSGNPVAQNLLRNCVFIIVPDLSPNATASGGVFDPDSGYPSTIYNPAAYTRFHPGSLVHLSQEAKAIWNRIFKFASSSGRIDLSINIHKGGVENLWSAFDQNDPQSVNFDKIVKSFLPGSGAKWVPNKRHGYSIGKTHHIPPDGWPMIRLGGRCWEVWRTRHFIYELSEGSAKDNYLYSLDGLKYMGKALALAVNKYYGEFSNSISVEYPTNNLQFKPGKKINVKWSSSGPGLSKVQIAFTPDGGLSWEILKKSVSNNGSYRIALPKVNSSLCQIKVFDYDNAGISGISSGYFKVGSQKAGDIRLHEPDAASVWHANSWSKVAWNQNIPANFLNIEMSPDGGKKWIQLAGSIKNKGRYNVNVPDVVSEKGKIKIYDARNPEVFGISQGFFKILPALPRPQMKLLYPDKNSVLTPGGRETIRWSADASIKSIGISISYDGGANWHTLVKSAINNGSYTFKVPEISSKNCLIWIYDNEPDLFLKRPDKDPQDISDNVFAILKTKESAI